MAPVRPAAVDELRGLYCYIEDLPEAVLSSSIPWDWERYPAYMAALAQRQFGVNVAALVGHTPIRMYVMGSEAWERRASEAERHEIAELLRECLRAGAFGLSSSLGFDEDRKKRPVPSRVADDAELLALFEVLAEEDRFLQFIASPVPKYTTRDVQRVADLCRPLGVLHTWISIFYDDQAPDLALRQLDFAAELQRSGARCYPQVSPRGLDIQVNWSGGMSFYTMPNGWHQAVQGDRRRKPGSWLTPNGERWPGRSGTAFPFTMIRHRLPDRIRLISVTRADNERWIGASFADLVAARGGHPSDVLADWVLENDLAPGVVGTGVVNSDPDGVAATLVHPAAVISNSDAGAHLQMMCAVGDTTLLLTRHVRDRGDLTVEDAVHQLTGRQAELFGFADRGVIREGAVADLTVFSLDELHWDEATMTADLPTGATRLRRGSGGFRYTVVEGPSPRRAAPSPASFRARSSGERDRRRLDSNSRRKSPMTGSEYFPHVFAPLEIGPVTVPNRLFVTPHGPGYITDDPTAPGFWLPAPNTLPYYRERARAEPA